MNARLCSKATCSGVAVATLTYSHEDRTAVLGQLTPVFEPHAYDLCEKHAKTMTPPMGWQLIRHVSVPKAESNGESQESKTSMPLNDVVKSYDVRGLVGKQLTAEMVSALAAAFVDEGPTMKRIRPRAQGRAYKIRKRSSHITVIVSDGIAAAPAPKVAAAKKAAAKVAAEETAAPVAKKAAAKKTAAPKPEKKD